MPYQEAINIEGILSFAIRKGASDVHICEGDHVAFRVHGHLGKLTQAGVLTKEVLHRLALEMFQEDAHRLEEFFTKKDVDFAFLSKDGTSFRVNGFFKLGRMGFVMRRIERNAKKMEDLGLPAGLEKILTAKQ